MDCGHAPRADYSSMVFFSSLPLTNVALIVISPSRFHSYSCCSFSPTTDGEALDAADAQCVIRFGYRHPQKHQIVDGVSVALDSPFLLFLRFLGRCLQPLLFGLLLLDLFGGLRGRRWCRRCGFLFRAPGGCDGDYARDECGRYWESLDNRHANTSATLHPGDGKQRVSYRKRRHTANARLLAVLLQSSTGDLAYDVTNRALIFTRKNGFA